MFLVGFFRSKLQLKDVKLVKLITKLNDEEMNKLTFCLVFACGVLSTCLLTLLTSLVPFPTWPSAGHQLGVLPAGFDLELMDDGYVSMALLGAHDLDAVVDKREVTDLEYRNSEIEALNTLKAAREMQASGKYARSCRLFEHAISLAPHHPDILVYYGEFLERQRKDVITADHVYLKALALSPTNSKALRNRRRTHPIVESLDSYVFSRIDSKRIELSKIPSYSGALLRIKKEAYYHYVYHTAGLEGNTMTLAETRMILETRLSVGGKSVLEHNEILGLDLALKYINTTLVHRIGKISLHDILEIHRRLLGHADPIEAGQMRTTQVFVSKHIPPPPTRLQVLMQDFLDWLNSAEAQRLHPIKYAALAHYKLVFIHPFSDGNGRTARLLMNFLLMQAGYPPVIIRKQDRMTYYECLQAANDGDTRPFVRFIALCTEKTLDVYLWATREALPEIASDEGNSIVEKGINSGENVVGRSKQSYKEKVSEETVSENVKKLDASDPENSDDNDYETDHYKSSYDYVVNTKGQNDHLWLYSEEETIKLPNLGRHTRVIDEEDVYNVNKLYQDMDIVINSDIDE